MTLRFKVAVPRFRKALDCLHDGRTPIGQVANDVAGRAAYAPGKHTLAHEGRPLDREAPLERFVSDGDRVELVLGA